MICPDHAARQVLLGDAPDFELQTRNGETIRLSDYKGKEVIVLDHHKPKQYESESILHVNPHLVGVDGSNEISGAGVSYLFAKAVAAKV